MNIKDEREEDEIRGRVEIYDCNKQGRNGEIGLGWSFTRANANAATVE